MEIEIIIVDRDMKKKAQDDIHNLLVGSKDYIESNIVLNIESGVYLFFDFANAIDKKDMRNRLDKVVNYMTKEGNQ